MRHSLLAGTAVLLFTAMPSAARADCLQDLMAARNAMARTDNVPDVLQEAFGIDYAAGLGVADSAPDSCKAIAQRADALAKLAAIKATGPAARLVGAMQEEAAATVEAVAQAREGGGQPSAALEAAAAVTVEVMNTHGVRINDLVDSLHAELEDSVREVGEARAKFNSEIYKNLAFIDPNRPESKRARDRLEAAQMVLDDVFKFLRDSTAGAEKPKPAKAPAKTPAKMPDAREQKEPVITDLEGYLESVCAPEAVMRQGKMVSGCTFWDRQTRTVPGPRKEHAHDADQPVQTIDRVQLEIDYMADQPRANVRYFLKDHHIEEKGAGGIILTDPWGGLIIRLDLPRGGKDTARLSFRGGKATIRGLAGIDYEVRHPAEPMDFTFDRDPANFAGIGQTAKADGEAPDYENSSQTETRANDLAHQAVRVELKNNYDKARAKMEDALRDQSNKVVGSNHRVADARADLIEAERAYSEYLRKNAPEDFEVHVRDWADAKIGPLKAMGDPKGPIQARDFVPLDPGSKPEALPEYDGPESDGPGMSPKERELTDRLQSSRNALSEAEARLAAAEGDPNAMREAREVYQQAFDAVARARQDYRNYEQTGARRED